MIDNILFFIIFISNTSCVFGHYYDECSSPKPCGNVSNIGYPFWGNGRSYHCGVPAFQLHCPDSNQYPVLQISDFLPRDDQHLYFNVLSISSISSKSYITIKLQPANSSTPCPSDFTKNSVFDFYLNFTSNVTVTRLYDKCRDNKNASDFVTCFNNDKYKHRYTYSPNGKGFEGCKDIEFPVLNEELNKLQQRKELLANVLKKGFEVNFNYSPCAKCEESGGVCVSSMDQVFACYCKDNHHAQSLVCNKSGNN